jgi:hypothetical protein
MKNNKLNISKKAIAGLSTTNQNQKMIAQTWITNCVAQTWITNC